MMFLVSMKLRMVLMKLNKKCILSFRIPLIKAILNQDQFNKTI